MAIADNLGAWQARNGSWLVLRLVPSATIAGSKVLSPSLTLQGVLRAAAWNLTDKHTSVPHLNLTEHKGLSP